jgi:gamma-glutamylcyclotransferase (GGCT)/AIG2-like uncharacterized protein YtfP
MMDRIPLFVYGTIGDPEIFERLLKRPPEYQPAKLSHYQLYVHPKNGYLFVKPQAEGQVPGRLIWINTQELKLLDLWEDLSLYQYEQLTIETGTNTQKAFVYTQNNTVGKPSSHGKAKDRELIINEIDEFLHWIDEQSVQ